MRPPVSYLTALALLVSVSVFELLTGCASTGTHTPQIKQAHINNTRLTYEEQGQGRTIVFVHGAITDYRAWAGQRDMVAAENRFIALTMRYFGTDPWPDSGTSFSVKTHTDDLVAFIQGLNSGPVDLVTWSYSGSIALLVAVRHPELVRGLFLYEPATLAFITDPEDLKVAMKDRAAMAGPAVAAVKGGDATEATRRLFNNVNDQPDIFDAVTPAIRSMLLDNARTLPLLFSAPPSPVITCEELGKIKVPTVVAVGEMTRPFFRIASSSVARCIPGAKLVVIREGRHAAPLQATSAWNEAFSQYLSGN